MTRFPENNNNPSCPKCGTNKRVSTHGQDQFFCGRCKGLFDSDPDEGGDYSDRNPALRMERQERRSESRK